MGSGVLWGVNGCLEVAGSTQGLVDTVGEEASARLSERWQCTGRVCAHS